jgi:hypothetical protein
MVLPILNRLSHRKTRHWSTILCAKDITYVPRLAKSSLRANLTESLNNPLTVRSSKNGRLETASEATRVNLDI